MTKKDSTRSTNPPYLGDYHRMRLYPRHWDMSELTSQNGVANSSSAAEGSPKKEQNTDEAFGHNLSPKAFEEWQISRHYPSDDTYRCDTFSAF